MGIVTEFLLCVFLVLGIIEMLEARVGGREEWDE